MWPFHATFAQSLKPGGWLVLGTGLGVALTISLQWIGFNNNVNNKPIEQPEPEPIELLGDLRIKGSPSLGSPKAPITIVEFSDFECTYCRRFHDQVLSQLKEQYVSTGLLRFVHKDLPLPFRQQAKPAAAAARCAVSAFMCERRVITFTL